MFDKNGNKIEIESKVYIDYSYGIVSDINIESNGVTVQVDGAEYTYVNAELLVIKDSIYNKLESIDKLIAETKIDIEWSDNDNTILILEEKIDNLKKEKEKIMKELESN